MITKQVKSIPPATAIIFATTILLVLVVVIVMMPVAGQLHDDDPHPSGDQQAADDGVLCALHYGSELQSDGHDDGAEHDREQDVRDAG